MTWLAVLVAAWALTQAALAWLWLRTHRDAAAVPGLLEERAELLAENARLRDANRELRRWILREEES